IFKEDAYNFGFSAGEEYGRNEGISYGEHKKATETAKNLLSLGLSHEQIASATGLSIEEIEKLQ
ncbi:MAG: hypothetical protein J1G30_04015, partial [Spirochaetales bacterium]|nr:hypothetical protein [Spirochaetales bacterium]